MADGFSAEKQPLLAAKKHSPVPVYTAPLISCIILASLASMLMACAFSHVLLDADVLCSGLQYWRDQHTSARYHRRLY